MVSEEAGRNAGETAEEVSRHRSLEARNREAVEVDNEDEEVLKWKMNSKKSLKYPSHLVVPQRMFKRAVRCTPSPLLQ